MRSNESVDCMGLPPGSLVEVETKNRVYRIECLGGNAVRISGHPEYCPTPVSGHLQGSETEAGVIERGQRLQLVLDHRGPLITSRVTDVRVVEPANRRAA